MVAKTTFLIQFQTENELLHVLHRGLWTYREDAIAIRRAHGPSDLESPKVDRVEITTQWHQIPLEIVKKEGIMLLAEEVGTPISEVTEVFIEGSRCYKIKISVPIDKPLMDRREITHPTLGTFTALIVYERVNRMCLFCARLGHDHHGCVNKVRIQRMLMDPKYRNKPNIAAMGHNRAGPWINNPMFIQNQDKFQPSPHATPEERAGKRGAGVDLNTPSQEKRDHRQAKEKASEMEGKTLAIGGTLKRMNSGPEATNSGQSSLGKDANLSDYVGTERQEHLVRHVNKKRMVEVSQRGPPPQEQ